MHFAEGGYERVAQKLLRDLDVDVYYVGDRPICHLDRSTDMLQRHSWSMITIVREVWSLCDTCRWASMSCWDLSRPRPERCVGALKWTDVSVSDRDRCGSSRTWRTSGRACTVRRKL